MVDLRSDTVTQPTIEMREAIANAGVGDDVLGDDPTVIKLQEMIANMLGKEAALYVPSGTMSNAVAIRTHTQPGDEIITERFSHIYLYEGGGYAALSGCSVALVEGELGILKPKDVENAIRKEKGSDGHYPNGTLVCIENTSNRGGGTFYDLESLDKKMISGEKQLELAQKGRKTAEALLESGRISQLDMEDAELAQLQAELGLLQYKFEYQTSMAALQRIIGRKDLTNAINN